MKSNYARVIGIDVSKDALQISDSKGKLCGAVDNRVSVIKSLVTKLDVVIANPAQMRIVAKGHGFLEKTDKIDAHILRLLGEQVQSTPATPRTS